MVYQVIKKETPGVVDGKLAGFNVQRYYATIYGREPKTEGHFADPFVEVWADGSITANWSDTRLFLYDDQWVGIIDAIKQALTDKKAKKDALRQKWLDDTFDSKVFHGTVVDLSRRQVVAALVNCQITIDTVFTWTSPRILYDGAWHCLGRTDLMDDAATSLCENKTAEEWREHYLKVAESSMGGRLSKQQNTEGLRLFSIIDSFSDG